MPKSKDEIEIQVTNRRENLNGLENKIIAWIEHKAVLNLGELPPGESYVQELNLAYDIHDLVELNRQYAVLKMKKFKMHQL